MIIVWRVLNACNLACPFCAFDKRLALPRTAIDPQEVLRFMAILASSQQRSGERVLMSWLGGEPFQWAPLEHLTLSARAQGLAVSATTNGTPLGSGKLRRHLCASYDELTISIDGFAGFHDRMRGWEGSFAKLRQWVPLLAQDIRASGSPLKLRANVVLMHQNLPSFPALCEQLSTWGIGEITFNQLGGRDRPEFYPKHRLTSSDANALSAMLPDLQRQLADSGTVVVGGPDYLARIHASTLDQQLAISDCGPGQRFLFIDEAGLISPCSFTGADYSIPLSEIVTVDDLAALPRRFRAMQSTRRASACDDCLSTQVSGKFRCRAAA